MTVKDEQIIVLEQHIKSLEEFTPMRIREYFTSVKEQLEEYIDELKAALDETRRRNLLDRRPSLVVVTRPDEGGRGRNYFRVYVRNSGPGVAHKVRVSLNWESLSPDLCQWGDKPVEASINSLPEQGTLELPREAPCTVTDKDRICGTMACEDGAGTGYWWRRVGPDADWQSGTGSLPNDS